MGDTPLSYQRCSRSGQLSGLRAFCLGVTLHGSGQRRRDQILHGVDPLTLFLVPASGPHDWCNKGYSVSGDQAHAMV